MRFFSHQANFNEIFGRKMSKSLTISPENDPCICDIKNREQGMIYLFISKGHSDIANSRGFDFYETSHMRSFAKIKLSQKFLNLQSFKTKLAVGYKPLYKWGVWWGVDVHQDPVLGLLLYTIMPRLNWMLLYADDLMIIAESCGRTAVEG